MRIQIQNGAFLPTKAPRCSPLTTSHQTILILTRTEIHSKLTSIPSALTSFTYLSLSSSDFILALCCVCVDGAMFDNLSAQKCTVYFHVGRWIWVLFFLWGIFLLSLSLSLSLSLFIFLQSIKVYYPEVNNKSTSTHSHTQSVLKRCGPSLVAPLRVESLQQSQLIWDCDPTQNSLHTVQYM